jgi:hypothetical protein
VTWTLGEWAHAAGVLRYIGPRESIPMAEAVRLHDVLELAKRLSPVDKVRLIERVAPEIARELASRVPAPRESLAGLCADLGQAPSAEAIDEARREAWGGFPRDDV